MVKTGRGWNWLWAAGKSYGGEESEQRLRAGNKPPVEVLWGRLVSKMKAYKCRLVVPAGLQRRLIQGEQ